MKAVYCLGDRKLEVRDVPDLMPGPDEVILEIKASGMCGSNLKYYRAADGTDSIHERSGGLRSVCGGVRGLDTRAKCRE